MKVVKNKILFSFLVAVWVMINSLMGCTSKNARTGSLILKGNDYEELLTRQMARASAEAPTQQKSPKMTDGEYERLGDAHVRQGNIEKAFMQYEKAIHLNPDKTRIHYKRGMLLLAKGVHEEAIEEFQEVLKKEPEDALAHEGIGHALFKMSRFEDSKKHFHQALKDNPKLWKSHNFLGIVHDYGKRPEAAIAEYQAAIALRPGDGLLYNNLGVSYALIGEYEKAISAFKEALKTSTSHRKIYNNLGLVLSVTGNDQEALEAFRRGGNQAKAYNNLGCIHFHQGEYDKAVRSFEKAMELAPTFYARASEHLKKAKTASLNESSSSSHTQTEPDIPPSSPASVHQESEPTLEPAVPSPKVVYAMPSAANVRTGASTTNKVITTVKRGDQLKVLGETDSWYNVKLPNGIEGWIHKKSVK